MNYQKHMWVFALLLIIWPATARATSSGSDYAGRIDADQFYHEIPLSITEPNQTLRITMLPENGDLDTMLFLLNQDGIILAQNDDYIQKQAESGSFIEFLQAATGDYRIIATRFKGGRGNSSGDFTLSIAIEPNAPALGAYDTRPETLTALGYPEISPRPTAEWTILAYYGGDTNLEADILLDFKEFELAGGSSEDVRIIAFVDRHPEFSSASGDWTSAKLFEITRDLSGLPENKEDLQLDTQELADLGILNSGSGEALAQFLSWGIQTYPARHYALAFASHGAAWAGLITDYSFDSIISLPELQQALGSIRDTLGIDKMDLLINDACLMSSVEYHAAMAPYFNLSIASPEIVYNPALAMDQLTQRIKDDPALDIAQLSSLLVDQYIREDGRQSAGPNERYLAYAVTDLDLFDPVTQAVEAFAALVNSRPEAYMTLLGNARAQSYTYTRFLGEETLIDLGSFMRQVIIQANDESIIQAAQAVLQALEASIRYSNGGERALQRVSASYHNIYFPADQTLLRDTYFLETTLPQWGQMLRNYYNALLPQAWVPEEAIPFHAPVPPQLRITHAYPEVGSIHRPFFLSLEMVGRKVSQASFVVDRQEADGSRTRLYSSELLTPVLDEFGNLTQIPNWNAGVDDGGFLWDTRLHALSDGQNSHYELLVNSDESFFLDGRYQESEDSPWYDVGVVFAYADDAALLSGRATVQSVVSRDENSSALGLIEIPDGAIFQSYRSVVGPDGRISREEGRLYAWQPDQLVLNTKSPAPAGDYELGFTVRSMSGESSFASLAVRIDNEGLDPQLMGDTSLIDGFSIILPSDWSTISFDNANIGSSFSADGTLSLSIYDMPADYDLAELPDVFAELYGFDIDSEAEEIELGGFPALRFRSSFMQDSEAIVEQISYAVLFSEDDALVFALAGDLAHPQFAQLEELLLTQSQLFAVEPVRILSEGDWYSDNFGGPETAFFPAPVDWGAQYFDDGIWYGYSADEQMAESASFIRFTQLNSADAGGINQALLNQALLNDEVMPESSDFELQAQRVYYGENLTWDVSLYQAQRAGSPVLGRLYTSVTQSGYAYAIWFETPNDEGAPARIGEIFEIMADGFAVPTSLRRQDLPELGLSLAYPREWLELYYSDEGMVVSDFSGRDFLLAYLYEDGSSDPALLTEDILRTFGLTRISQAQPMEIAGLQGYQVRYHAELDEDIYYGIGFVTSIPDTGTGLMLSIESLESEDVASALFSRVVTQTRFSSTQPVASTSAAAYSLPSIRIYRDEYGFSYEMPATFSLPEYDEELFIEESYSPGEEIRIIADYYDYDPSLSMEEFVSSTDLAISSQLPATRDDQAILLFDYTIDYDGALMNGRAIAFEQPDANLVMLLRVEALPGLDIDATFALLRDSLRLHAPDMARQALTLAKQHIAIASTPLDESRGSINTQTFADAELGLIFDYPSAFPPLILSGEEVLAESQHPDLDITLRIQFIPGDIGGLARMTGLYYPPVGQVNMETIPPLTVSGFDYAYDDEGKAIQGKALSFYIEPQTTGVIISVESADPNALIRFEEDDEYESIAAIYELLHDSLGFVTMAETSPNGLITRPYRNSAYGFELAYPIQWEPMRYNSEQAWYWTLSEEQDTAIYVYIAEAADLQSAISSIAETLALMLESPIEAADAIDSYEAARFSHSYKFNGIWQGEAIAIHKDGIGLIFSAETLEGAEDLSALFDNLLNSLSFTDTNPDN